MNLDLEQEILHTLCYADVFSCALTRYEIYAKLQGRSYSIKQVTQSLTRLCKNKTVTTYNGFYALHGMREYCQIRKSKIKTAKKKLLIAQKHLTAISYPEWVLGVYVTGSVAAYNCQDSEDIDLMIICKDNTLWLARPWLLYRSRLRSYKRTRTSPYVNNLFCINLFLEECTLQVPQHMQNVFTAHEVIQAKPICCKQGVHEQFLQANSWVDEYLPQAREQSGLQTALSLHNSSIWSFNRYTAWINRVGYGLQYMYMKPKVTNESISLHHAYFHPINRQKSISAKFSARKRAFRLV